MPGVGLQGPFVVEVRRMALSKKRRQYWIAANQQEYSQNYSSLLFLSADEYAQAHQSRQNILDSLASDVATGCCETKLDMNNLSPGCRICADGDWSCLFINGRCNCDCFYCPTSQQEIGQPTTNSIEFRHAEDYVLYLQRFGFRGASFSGGEPLLTFDRTLHFLKTIKAHMPSDFHTWLYTNGSLLTDQMVDQLAAAGLDEIRFDIGATSYQLTALKRVGNAIPVVTVEIPAVPEETERLKELLPQLVDSGVRHLNLHQLRLTPYNYPRLIQHDYRYLHGERVTVLDSELAALELLEFVHRNDIGLPINYCSFVYKHRFQAQAARLRNGHFMAKSYECLTENGYIRTLILAGEVSRLQQLCRRFSENNCDPTLWSLVESRGRLHVHPCLWPLVELDGVEVIVDYAFARQLPQMTYRNPFTGIELSSRQEFVIERSRAGREIVFTAEQAEFFVRNVLLANRAPKDLGDDASTVDEFWEDVLAYETIPHGLQEYY